VSFYQRARHNPAIAAEVLVQLDLDLEMKRAHLALYLCCRECLRLHETRTARDQRIGRGVRWLVNLLSVRALAGLRRTLGRVADVALACLPGGAAEPAKAQVRRLAADPAIRAARTRYRREAAGSVAMATPASAPEVDMPAEPASPAVRVAKGG
jgi:hypothetical protein